ncbi:hypothetical protein FFZ99_16350 [Leptospira interrogans]|nr:hypothetical protein FF006_15745 [Leptospira interrogans]TQE61352.1 hypothetical protein FFZ99_16350 [Leptospira interrogans]TQE65082.1 hypothetical protein FF001_14980 [Leptospira interrogans]TQE69897.1 hypothetical protein FF002_16135 [Leptospira interrogans]
MTLDGLCPHRAIHKERDVELPSLHPIGSSVIEFPLQSIVSSAIEFLLGQILIKLLSTSTALFVKTSRKIVFLSSLAYCKIHLPSLH